MSVCRRHGSSFHKISLDDLEFGKESPDCGTFAKGDCRKLSNYLYSIMEERFQTSTSINQVPAKKPGSSKSYFVRVFSRPPLACIVDLLTALELSITYNDLPLRTCINLGTRLS
jgi:hypothetical protein